MKKNILIFGHGYAQQFIDISNQYTKLFNEDQFEVTVVYLTGEGSESIRNKHLAKHVIFINSPRKSTRGLKLVALKKMLLLQKQKKFEIAICHRYKPTYIMVLISRLYPIPQLLSVMHELNTMQSISRRLFIACFSAKNLTFAGVSNAVRDDLRKSLWRIPKERIITLYNTIDVDLTEPKYLSREQAREKLKLPKDAFIFGNLGRLVINKDQKTLVEAFSKIKPFCPLAKLIILGEGVLEEGLKKQITELKLENDIILAGYLDEGFQYMKAFDVYISSSTQEAFGRVLLEAMLAKIPVIATRVNGVPEVVGNAGILIEKQNPDSLAENMTLLYESSQETLRVMQNQAYEWVVKNFSQKYFQQTFNRLFFNG